MQKKYGSNIEGEMRPCSEEKLKYVRRSINRLEEMWKDSGEKKQKKKKKRNVEGRKERLNLKEDRTYRCGNQKVCDGKLT